MTAEDAHLACEHGAAGVVVSNHGGRQLDGAAATIDALPEVVEAVEGRVEVLVDGGVRRGADVVRALALGARAVLAGRAPLWGLAARGEQGAREVLELLREEIELALVLIGCASPGGRDAARTSTRAAPDSLPAATPTKETHARRTLRRGTQRPGRERVRRLAPVRRDRRPLRVADAAAAGAASSTRRRVEERGHAMMMIKYLLDTDSPVRLREVAAPATRLRRPHRADPARARAGAHGQRRRSASCSRVAREEGDYLSEQFVQWFLKEQVEEEATMTELLDVAERVRDFPMTLEEYIAREQPGRATTTTRWRPSRPAARRSLADRARLTWRAMAAHARAAASAARGDRARCGSRRRRAATAGSRRCSTRPTPTTQLKAWWHVAQVNADRLGMSDHSWVHIQIVANIALRLFRLLNRRGVEPDIVRRLRHAARTTPRS